MTASTITDDLLFQELGLLIQEGRRVVLPVKGKSMLPFLHEGSDKVLLEKAREVEIGDIVLVCLPNGMHVLHRVFSIHNDQLVLMGDGNVYGKETCTFEDVIAKVVAILRNGKEITCANGHKQRYVRLWRQLLPIRRYLLFIYRHLS